MQDKGDINDFLDLLDTPLKVESEMQNISSDISDLKILGNTDWIDLIRDNNQYWDVGMKILRKALMKSRTEKKQPWQKKGEEATCTKEE